jgi:alpha-glucosidase
VEDFKPRDKAPLVMGTPTHMLASYVVYQNHLSMVADYPSAYRSHPALPMLAKIPASWDDTRYLSGSVGEYLVLARRHDTDWYIGAMNGRKGRTVQVPLSFLEAGRYRAEIYADDMGAAYHLSQRTKAVTNQEAFTFQLAPAGGGLVRLSRNPEQPNGK